MARAAQEQQWDMCQAAKDTAAFDRSGTHEQCAYTGIMLVDDACA